jgi:hypothetical protein
MADARRVRFLVPWLLACGGNGATLLPTDAAVDVSPDVMQAVDASDAKADVAVEAGAYGAPSSTYPAFTPWMGQLTNNGGPILSAPIVVTITWDDDTTGRPIFEPFGDEIGASSYWSAAVGEWGVGPVTSGAPNHVHISTTAPTQWADSDVQTFIQGNMGGVLPTYAAQMIYVFYISPSTTFMFEGQNACGSIGGYHDDFVYNTTDISYAVLPHCSTPSKMTQYASHEIGEASTDPDPSTRPGINGFDDPYLAFEEWQRGNVENGDACEFFPDSDYTEMAPFAFQVQRLWSNKMGPLGHSPCQPFTTPYFNMAPLMLEDIMVDLSSEGGPANFATKGYTCALNQTIQIPIGFYSDSATGPWTVTVAESNPLVDPVTGRLTLSIDPAKTSGVNGEQTNINVTVIAQGPLNAELLTIISTLGTTTHYLPLLIAN